MKIIEQSRPNNLNVFNILGKFQAFEIIRFGRFSDVENVFLVEIVGENMFVEPIRYAVTDDLVSESYAFGLIKGASRAAYLRVRRKTNRDRLKILFGLLQPPKYVNSELKAKYVFLRNEYVDDNSDAFQPLLSKILSESIEELEISNGLCLFSCSRIPKTEEQLIQIRETGVVLESCLKF